MLDVGCSDIRLRNPLKVISRQASVPYVGVRMTRLCSWRRWNQSIIDYFVRPLDFPIWTSPPSPEQPKYANLLWWSWWRRMDSDRFHIQTAHKMYLDHHRCFWSMGHARWLCWSWKPANDPLRIILNLHIHLLIGHCPITRFCISPNTMKTIRTLCVLTVLKRKITVIVVVSNLCSKSK